MHVRMIASAALTVRPNRSLAEPHDDIQQPTLRPRFSPEANSNMQVPTLITEAVGTQARLLLPFAGIAAPSRRWFLTTIST